MHEAEYRKPTIGIKAKLIYYHDAGASWDSFTQALTSEKPSMLQFKIREALVVLNDSYDMGLQMRPYELNNSLISWEGSYDASKKINRRNSRVEDCLENKLSGYLEHK